MSQNTATSAPATTGVPKYPDVVVQLSGEDGNSFAILGRINRALRAAGHADAVGSFTAEATAGDYSHLLATAMRWVEVT